jgi:uncharacterized protein with HEPN domain
MDRDEPFLLDILRYCERAMRAAKGRRQKDLDHDEALQSLLSHSLIIIGEAVKRLSMEFREKHSEIPWAEIAGMRDRLIHAYHRTDWDLVWKAATENLPRLAEFVRNQGVS